MGGVFYPRDHLTPPQPPLRKGGSQNSALSPVTKGPRRALWHAAIPNVFSLLIVLLLASLYFGAFADLDWSWQVRTGELIARTGNLRIPESFSYTIPGTVINDFEWLYELLLWTTWHWFGFGGLRFLKVIVVITPLIVVAGQLRRERVRLHGVAVAIIVAVFVLSSAWNLRPLYCTTIGLLLVATALHNHCTGIRPLPWWLPVVMLLWANLHPGVIVGQALLLGAIAWEWLNSRLHWNWPLDRPSLRRLTLIGGLSLAATFISPAPIERLRYPFRPELAHPIMRIFKEMTPLAELFAEAPLQIGLLYACAGLTLLTIACRLRYYRLWELALLGGLAFLASVAFRAAMDWLLVMLALGVPHARDLLVNIAAQRRRFLAVAWLVRVDRKIKQMFASPWFRWQPAWSAAALGVLLLISVVPPLARALPMRNAADWPVAALDYAEKAKLTGRFFAPPDFGSYIGWRLGDAAKVYADTRGFFFPPELLEDSYFIPQLGPKWRERLNRVLDAYHTDYFLLETTGSRGALWRLLRQHGATPLFVDAQCVLLSATEVSETLARH